MKQVSYVSSLDNIGSYRNQGKIKYEPIVSTKNKREKNNNVRLGAIKIIENGER